MTVLLEWKCSTILAFLESVSQ